jgi:hypothetical protein
MLTGRYCADGEHRHCGGVIKFANADNTDECFPCGCDCHGTSEEHPAPAAVVGQRIPSRVDAGGSLEVITHPHTRGPIQEDACVIAALRARCERLEVALADMPAFLILLETICMDVECKRDVAAAKDRIAAALAPEPASEVQP